jgi:hypothetical protein
MPIVINCKCGHKLRVKDELAGKRVRCPGCSQVVPVPPPEEPIAEVVAVEEESPPASREAPRRRPAPPPAAKPSPEQRPGEQDEERPEPTRGPEGPTPFWVNGSELLAIADDALYQITLDEPKLRKAQKALEDGSPAAEAVEGAETVIPWNIVTKVEGNLHHTFFDVKYQAPEDKEESEKTIHCADHASRDEVLKAIRQRLGPGWKREVKEFNRLRASMEPLIVIAFFSFVTFCFYMAGRGEDSGGSHTVRTNWIGLIFVWVYNLLGPWGVVSVGGLCIALGVAWLVARLIKPPLMCTISPRDPPPRRRK